MPERPGRDARAGLWEAGGVVRPAGSDGSDGVGLSSTGALSVDGLTWLGARVYDPATRSFLSRDPLPPVLGAGWAANPYSWAGNDPVNLADPSGAHPLTDAEMEAWRDSHKTGLAAVGDHLADNWQYIVGGIVLGTVLTAACGPVLGGALTGAIISGWQNVDQQAASGGPFDAGGFVRAVVLGGASAASRSSGTPLTPLMSSCYDGGVHPGPWGLGRWSWRPGWRKPMARMRTRLASRRSGSSGAGVILREISTSLGRSASVHSRQSIQFPPPRSGAAYMSFSKPSGRGVNGGHP